MTRIDESWLINCSFNISRKVRALPHIDRDDIQQEVIVAALEAESSYDPSRGVHIKGFLMKRMVGAAYDYFRKIDTRPRSVSEDAKKFARVEHEIEKLKCAKPTPQDMADAFGVTLEKFEKIRTRIESSNNIDAEYVNLYTLAVNPERALIVLEAVERAMLTRS